MVSMFAGDGRRRVVGNGGTSNDSTVKLWSSSTTSAMAKRSSRIMPVTLFFVLLTIVILSNTANNPLQTSLVVSTTLSSSSGNPSSSNVDNNLPDICNDEIPFPYTSDLPPPPVWPPTATFQSVEDSGGTTIPHNLIFTSKTNLLETKTPTVLYKNVQNTIDKYTKLFAKASSSSTTTTNVLFYTDNDCRQLIATFSSKNHSTLFVTTTTTDNDSTPKDTSTPATTTSSKTLLDYFTMEPVGKYRADMCRIASLYVHGGYYFDVDLQVITPIQGLSSKINFITSRETGDFGSSGFFQAFTAATPGHAILKQALQEMLEFYKDQHSGGSGTHQLGTTTLRRAHDKIVRMCPTKRQNVWLLQESHLDSPQQFPSVKRQQPQSVHTGYGCNFVVNDGTTAYFFSRAIGAKSNNIDGGGCW